MHSQVSWHTHTYDMAHSCAWRTYVWPDSFMCVTCRIQMRNAAHSHVSYCNTLQHTATHGNTLQHTQNNTDSFMCVTCLIQMRNAAHSHVTYCNTLQHTATHGNTLQHTQNNTDSSMCVTCLIQIRNATHSHVSWLIHTWHTTRSNVFRRHGAFTYHLPVCYDTFIEWVTSSYVWRCSFS